MYIYMFIYSYIMYKVEYLRLDKMAAFEFSP